MKKQSNFSGSIRKKTLTVLKVSIYLCNLAAITLFVLLRILSDNHSFSASDDLFAFINSVAMGSAIAFTLTGLYFLILLINHTSTGGVQFRRILSTNKFASVIVIASTCYFTACDYRAAVGIKKDFNTGLTSSYKNIEPEKVMLIMNGEVLNHNDIPLGESFVLVNDNVEGLTVKDGKVAVGCALKITDKDGKEVLNEPDLLRDGGIYNEEDAHYLKCTVSTGSPMQWDENYDVKVKFWDKYGNGQIENDLSIHIIDLP